MPQSETDPRGSERAFERGSYDSVATFAKQWNAGQTEWVKSASKRTEMAQVERARFEDNSGAIVSEERVSLQHPLSKNNPRLGGDSLQICRSRQQTLRLTRFYPVLHFALGPTDSTLGLSHLQGKRACLHKQIDAATRNPAAAEDFGDLQQTIACALIWLGVHLLRPAIDVGS
jgi:hypothetical protein